MLSTLVLSAAFANPEVELGRPPEWPDNSFQPFSTCANSMARAHTMAQMKVDFTNSCADVMAEISARAGSAADGGSWVDPHNRGHYTVLETEGNLIKIQRFTQRYKYRDVITFSLEKSGTGCTANACAVSQGNSNDSGGTDMCDMGNLFCNSAVVNPDNGVACKDIKYNLKYTVPVLNCGRYDGNGQYLQHNCQEFTTTCLKNPAMEESLEATPAMAPKVVLGRPPEWPDNNFQLFATCANSQARAHTMAEMKVDFTNSCADVMAEISARAGAAADGGDWVDPHNRGHYTVLETQANFIKIQRFTQRYKYRDVITFSLAANGAGCTANACAVSQGNSNDSGGTDMCDMANLFCNSDVVNPDNGVACKDLKYKLEYTVPMLNCGRYDGNGQYLQHNCQEFTTTCLRNPATAALETAAVVKLEQPVLGRPPEWPETSFQQFATCANSMARAHTMSEMQVDFTNSCTDVMTEIAARAGAVADGTAWVDPHNMGHYTILEKKTNFIKIQRFTKRYKYRDVITFSLTTSGTGCSAQACAVSQGNSNDSGGTDMCDMGNLFCNSDVVNPDNGVACKDLKEKLTYTVPLLNCGRYDGNGQYLRHNCQDFATTCLKNAATLEQEAPQKVLRYLLN